MLAAPLARAHLAQYTIESSDVLAEPRVNVLEEGTKNVVWYKERDMSDLEIIESVVESATNSLRWTIHRPKRGWYIRLRAPSFPPGTYISLLPPTPPLPTPPPGSSPTPALPHTAATPSATTPDVDGILTFAVRTTLMAPETAAPGEVRINISVHSYPPTPPAPSPSSSQTLAVPSPRELNAKLRALSPRSNIMRFVLSPSLPVPASVSAPSPTSALLSRAFAFLNPQLPIRATASFTLAPAPGPDAPPPLLTFTDRTSTFSVRTTGLLQINKGLERQMGVEPAFWIAVALAYLEFLADRDSYLAAANG